MGARTVLVVALACALAAPAWSDQAKKTPPEKAKQPAVAGQTCRGKSTCKEMSSCSEARFYLTQCGVSKLDRDGDGIPCESLCKR